MYLTQEADTVNAHARIGLTYEVMANMTHPILMYDGFCGLCARITQFTLKRDPGGVFRFAAIQSAFAGNHIRAHGKEPDDLDTLYVLVDPGEASEKLLSRGEAAMYVLSRLGGPWTVVSWLRVLPHFLLDAGYNLVAKNRYRLFGRSDSCLLPKPEWRERFIAVE